MYFNSYLIYIQTSPWIPQNPWVYIYIYKNTFSEPQRKQNPPRLPCRYWWVDESPSSRRRGLAPSPELEAKKRKQRIAEVVESRRPPRRRFNYSNIKICVLKTC